MSLVHTSMLSVIMCYDNSWLTYGPEETVSTNANKNAFGAVAHASPPLRVGVSKRRRGGRRRWAGRVAPARPRHSLGEQVGDHACHRGTQASRAVPPVRADAVIQRGKQGERQRYALRLHAFPSPATPPPARWSRFGGAGVTPTLSVIMYNTNTTQGALSRRRAQAGAGGRAHPRARGAGGNVLCLSLRWWKAFVVLSLHEQLLRR